LLNAATLISRAPMRAVAQLAIPLQNLPLPLYDALQHALYQFKVYVRPRHFLVTSGAGAGALCNRMMIGAGACGTGAK
jgi:hypothetical protein